MEYGNSSEYLIQQVESLKRELEDCRKAQEKSQSERKQAEEKYHRVLESRFEGFMMLDCDLKINEVNNHNTLEHAVFMRVLMITQFYDSDPGPRMQRETDFPVHPDLSNQTIWQNTFGILP